MKLTNRQETFIRNLLEMYLESQEPIHYTVLAERLGVSRFTAYDMLRVLEEKGFACSEYKLAEEGKSGRSERVFLPTEKAKQMVQVITGEEGEYNWDSIKERLLSLMENDDIPAKELGPEILMRVPPEADDHFQYCIEVITILALQTRQYQDKMEAMNTYAEEFFASNIVSNRTILSMISGFMLGVLSQEENFDEVWMDEMVAHVLKYQEIVIAMSEDEATQLADGMQEHFPELFAPFPDEK